MKLNKTQYFIRPSLCLATLFFLCTSTVSALSSDKESSPENFCHTSDIKNKFITQNDSFNVQATKDLDAIFEQGILRVLLQKKNDDCIVSKTEKLLIEEFANTHGLKINWFYVNNEWELVSELIVGNGDVVVGQNQSLVSKLHNQINFTHAWTSASYKIVQRRDNSRIKRIQDLTGRHVAAYKASPVWSYLVELSKTQTGMVLQEIPKFDSSRKL